MKSIFLFFFLSLFCSLNAILYLPSNQPVNTLLGTNTDAPTQLTFQGPNAGPQIAVSTNGQAIAIWTNFPNQIEIQGMFFDGNQWVPLLETDGVTPFTLSVIDPFALHATSPRAFAIGSSPKVGIDRCGNSIVVWVSPTNQIQIAFFAGPILRETGGEVFPVSVDFTFAGNITQLTQDGTFNISPSISVNELGQAMVVWIQMSPYQVLAKTFRPSVDLSTCTACASCPATGGTWDATFAFLPQPFGNQPNGTYPANFGLGTNDTTSLPGKPVGQNTLGTAIWLDAPTGIIYAKNFLPFFPETVP